MLTRRRFFVSCLLLLIHPPLAGAQHEMAQAWSQPFPPFRIVGNLYYVGTNELGAYLVTSPAGHALIDGGFDITAPLILDSIRTLGFKPEDVKMLLTTQAHMDHVGSMSALKKVTGAQVAVMKADARMIRAGGHGDFAFGDTFTFPPVEVDRVLRDGDTVTLGDTVLTARLTPGHTQGCTTWTLNVRDEGALHKVVIAGSLSVNPPVRLTKSASYPGIREDYERSFRIMRSLETDVFVGAHAGFFQLHEKAERLRKGERPNPFIDPAGFRAWIDRMEKEFRQRIHGEGQ